MTWEEKVIDFQNYLYDEKKFSTHTRDSYYRDIVKLKSYCKIYFEDIGPDEITADQLQKYFDSLSVGFLNERTQERFVTSVRSFFLFLNNNKIRADNPAKILQVPKLGIYLKDMLTAEQIEMIMLKVTHSTVIGQKHYCILELLYMCGLTFSELSALKISDVNFEKSLVTIKRMNSRNCIIPLTPVTCKILAAYIIESRPQHKEIKNCKDILFLSDRGFQINNGHILLFIQNLLDQVGINHKVTKDTFQHSFAIQLLKNGADLNSIEFLLGHRSWNKNLKTDPKKVDELREIIIKYHPRFSDANY